MKIELEDFPVDHEGIRYHLTGVVEFFVRNDSDYSQNGYGNFLETVIQSENVTVLNDKFHKILAPKTLKEELILKSLES